MPAFQKIKESFQPCRAPEFRQFDFWVGDWEVQNPVGQTIGDNQVTLEQNGCLLVEHWKSGLGVETGSSFNYYDSFDRQWHQNYIPNSGIAHAPMAGGLRDGRMVLLAEPRNGVQERWTWYVLAPGKVRQMAEQTADGGKTWAVVWDSVYVKRPNGAATP